jgi:hypothetical protein
VTWPTPCVIERVARFETRREIVCRTHGVPVPDGVRIDADGFAVFVLDPAKHDPFVLFDRLRAAVDAAAK